MISEYIFLSSALFLLGIIVGMKISQKIYKE